MSTNIAHWHAALRQAVVENNESAVSAGFQQEFLKQAPNMEKERVVTSTDLWPKVGSSQESLLHTAAKLGHAQLTTCLLDHAREWHRKDQLSTSSSPRNHPLEGHMWLLRSKSDGKTAMELAIDAKQWDAAISLLHAQFASGCGKTLLHAVQIYEKAKKEAGSAEEDSDFDKSEKQGKLAAKAITTAEALLHTLEGVSENAEGEVVEFLLDSTFLGQALLIQLINTQCQPILTLPRVSTILEKRWRGKLLDQVLSGNVAPPFGDKIDLEADKIRARTRFWAQRLATLPNHVLGSYRLRCWIFLVVVVVNILLLLPLVLLVPPLGHGLQTKLLPALGAQKKKSSYFKHRVPWLLIFVGLGGMCSSVFLTSTTASIVLFAYGVTSLCLGTAAVVAGPHRPHTAAAKQSYSEFWLLYWSSLYLLDKPFFNFWLTVGFNMMLAIYLALLPSPEAEHGHDDGAHWNSFFPDPAQLFDPEHTTLWLALALIWLVTALLNELMEILRSDGELKWRRDTTNYVEAPMLLGATIAIASRMGLGQAVGELLGLSRLAPGHDIPLWEQQILSISIVGVVIVNGLRAMMAFRSLGPLVLMTLQMVIDVARWLCVPIIVTIAFIFGFYSLHKGMDVAGMDDECDVFKEHLAGAPLTIGLKLFAPILGSDSMHECTLSESRTHTPDLLAILLVLHTSPLTAGVMNPDAQWPAVNLADPFLMIVYLLLTAVLLLNMLIAMMANTFDEMWQDQQKRYKMLQSQISLQYKAAQEREGAPAPFTLLTYPYRLFLLVWHLASCGSLAGPKPERGRTRSRSNPYEQLIDGASPDVKASIFDKICRIYAEQDPRTPTGEVKWDDLWLKPDPTDRWGSAWHEKWEDAAEKSGHTARRTLEDEVNEHVDKEAGKTDTNFAVFSRVRTLDTKIDQLQDNVKALIEEVRSPELRAWGAAGAHVKVKEQPMDKMEA